MTVPLQEDVPQLQSPTTHVRENVGLDCSLRDAPDATLVVAASGDIVFANDLAAGLFGFTRQELLTVGIDRLLPERMRAAHVASRARYRAAPTARTMGADLDVWAMRSDGTTFPTEISLRPMTVLDVVYTVCAVRDITDRVTQKHDHQRVLHVLDASDDGVFIFDADTLRYTYVNAGAVRLVGYSVDELLTMTPSQLNPFEAPTDYRQLVGALGVNGTAGGLRQAALLRKDGTRVAVEISLQMAPADQGDTGSVIALARDVTARRAAERALRSSQGALREATGVIASDRERIARDLHDTVIQRLFGEGLNLQAALVSVTDPERTRQRLQSTIDGLDQAVTDLRTAIFSLQGVVNAPGDLRKRLASIVAQATGMLHRQPRLRFDGPIETISAKITEHLLPVLREALSNATRHAHANNVDVDVRVSDRVTLIVCDDGNGVQESSPAGEGLKNMDARAAALNGSFTLCDRPSGGTKLTWQVPAEPS